MVAFPGKYEESTEKKANESWKKQTNQGEVTRPNFIAQP
jgi:hypothetical protein